MIVGIFLSATVLPAIGTIIAVTSVFALVFSSACIGSPKSAKNRSINKKSKEQNKEKEQNKKQEQNLANNVIPTTPGFDNISSVEDVTMNNISNNLEKKRKEENVSLVSHIERVNQRSTDMNNQNEVGGLHP